MIIAVDGFVATGKSTVGEVLGKRLDHLYIDTGIMYRVVGLIVHENGLDPDNENQCAEVAQNLDLHLRRPRSNKEKDGRQLTVIVDQRDVTWDIRQPIVEEITPKVSRHSLVRSALISKQRRIAKRSKSVIMVGRDITSVVLPDADLKILLTASLEERVRRRSEDFRRRDVPASMMDIRDSILRRDHQDEVNMKLADGTHIIDTTALTIEEVVNEIVSLASQVKSEN